MIVGLVREVVIHNSYFNFFVTIDNIYETLQTNSLTLDQII